jgi:N utilization substance protein B
MPDQPLSEADFSRGPNDFSARLVAVQAVYQMMLNPQPVSRTLQEYLDDHKGRTLAAEEAHIPPNAGLLKRILLGLEAHRARVEDILNANVRQRESNQMQPLLHAILLCGVYEIMDHAEIDHPLIISDYLNVAHGFYDKKQVAFVNGVLDSAAGVLRVKSV